MRTDYQYAKFTGLTSPAFVAQGQTEVIIPLWGFLKVVLDVASPFTETKIQLLRGDSTVDTISFTVKGPDGTTDFTSGGAAGYDQEAYYAFHNAIVDYMMDLTKSNKAVQDVKCGLGGDIAPTLGVITGVQITS